VLPFEAEQLGPLLCTCPNAVPNLSSPPSLAGQPLVRHCIARQDDGCQTRFFPKAPPAHPRWEGKLKQSGVQGLPSFHQHIPEGWGFQEPPSPPNDLPALPGSCRCCLQAAATGPPGFTERWDALEAAFTRTSLVSRSIFTQSYYSSSWVLWPLNGFKICCYWPSCPLPAIPTGNTPHCSVLQGEAQAGEHHDQHHPAQVGAAPRAPISPFSSLAAPPTAHHRCCGPLKGTDLPAAATLLRPCYCCIYVFMINSPEQLINPQCQGYRQRRGHVSKAACICSPAARSPGPLERILGNVAKGLWESCGNLPPYYPAFNLALVGRK